MKNYNYSGYNSNLKDYAKELRHNMTKQERHLWFCFLKNYPLKFVSQRIIDKYIADFYCSKAKLVVELDGNQHYTDIGEEYDKVRSNIINKYGIEVIRFSNYDVDTNFEGVCIEIDKAVKKRVNFIGK